MAERLPESLVSRFATTVRDVLWFRPKVERFLTRCGVSSAIMADLRNSESKFTVTRCLRVVDLLEQSGDQGGQVLQRLMREISEWDDFSHLSPEKQVVARQSQKEFKDEIRKYADRQRYLREQEKQQHREREDRTRIRPLDHDRLAAFRARFDETWAMTNAQARGNAFERLLNEVFDYYCPESRGPFRRDGEQIDGHFRYDGHDYFCEIRWRSDKTDAAAVSVLRDRATRAFGGDVRALFISFNGFTSECLDAMQKRAGQERVILMDGVDVRAILNSDLAFDVLLKEKLAYAVREERAFVTAREIMIARMDRGST